MRIILVQVGKTVVEIENAFYDFSPGRHNVDTVFFQFVDTGLDMK